MPSRSRTLLRQVLGSRRRQAYAAYLNAVLVPRQMTAPWRRRPDFVVIGGQKCGTASLFAYLAAHPRVGRSLKKEVSFFNANYERGEQWYRAFFPLQLGNGAGWITGEATPDYIFDPAAPDRIRRFDPHIKLIALLRDPVRRTWSHYRHNVRLGQEHRSFEEALAHETDTLERRLREAPEEGRRDLMLAERRYFYLARGRYHEQLARWLSVFPREQVLILKSEDFFRETERTYAHVLGFLGLEQAGPRSFEAHNEDSGRQPLDPERAARLRDYFRPHNEALARLLDWRDVPWSAP